MANSHVPRRALGDLSINAFGAPKRPGVSPSSNISHKRQIHEVDDPTPSPAPARPRASENAGCLDVKPLREGPKHPSTQSPRATSKDCNDRVVDENSQNTSNHTVSTTVDSDLEGNTIDTQETATTELSQETATTELSQRKRPSPSTHAETLRLRLRLAMFKVETDQTNIPFSRLRIPSFRTQTDTLLECTSPSCNAASHPTLLPAPVLKPPNRRDGVAGKPHILSSPPSSGRSNPVKKLSPDTFRTSVPPRQREQPNQQTSSPPESKGGFRCNNEAEVSRLSSSAVKGHAAISLLDLRDDRR